MVTQNKQAPATVTLSTEEAMRAEIETLKAQLAKAAEEKQANKGKGTVAVKIKPRTMEYNKVEKKNKETGGTVVTYGLGRFPVTLYAGQQDRYDSPEVMAMRCKAIIENIDILSFDEETEAERNAAKAHVLKNAKLRLAFLATFDDFAKNHKG